MHDLSTTNQELIEENFFLKQRIQELEQLELEREITEAARRESEERYRAISDYSNSMICIVDENARIVWVNGKMVEISGYSEMQLLSAESFIEFLAPESVEFVVDNFTQFLSGSPYEHHYQFYFNRKSGERRLVEKHMTDYTDMKGKKYLIISMLDITDHKQAEENDRLKTVAMEATVSGMAILNKDGKYVYLNNAHARIYGYDTVGELIGKSWRLLYDGDQLQRFEQKIMPGFAEKGHWHGEAEGTKKDGSKFHQEVYLTALDNGGLICVVQDITDRKRAEEVLQESEKKFKRLADNMHDMIVEVDVEGKRIYVSPSHKTVLGIETSDLLNKSAFDRIHPDDLQHTVDAFTQGITTKSPVLISYRFLDSEGNYPWLENYGCPLYDSDHVLIGGIIVSRDITARKLAEEKLNNQMVFVETLLDTIPSPVFFKDTLGKYLGCNRAFEEFFGKSRSFILGKTTFDIAPEEIANKYNEKDWELFENPGTQTYEGEVAAPDGSIRDVLINKATYTDTCKNVIGLVGVLMDITVHKQDEKALRESEEKYRQLVENINQGIFVAQDGMLRFVNHMCMKIIGYSEQDLTTRPFIEFIHPDDRYMVLERHLKRMGGEELPSRYEFRIVACDGGTKWVEIDSAMIQWNDEQASLGFISDITERKLLESQLLQAQKMEAIGTLSGGIAHDFNNILGAIIGNTDMALMELKSDTHLEKYLKRVSRAGERAKDLVKQILIFSRQHEKDLQPLKMNPMIKEVMKLIRATLPSSIRVQQEIKAYPDTVLADPTQIHQVIMNLSTNAAHAMREGGGTLKISLTNLDVKSDDLITYPVPSSGSYIKLTVSDTGHGMEPSVQERIFEPFFTTKKQGEGTGLGLSVVHGIVKNHGGALTVESEPRKGTSFHIFFPTIYEEEENIGAETEISVPRGKERILFVDDEEELVRLAEDMLTILGYKVIGMTDSMDALDLFNKRPDLFDIVITDQTMPDLTGKELAKKLLRVRPDIPIILCTGFLNQITFESMKSAGIRESILKPVNIRMIAEAIRRVLDQKE